MLQCGLLRRLTVNNNNTNNTNNTNNNNTKMSVKLTTNCKKSTRTSSKVRGTEAKLGPQKTSMITAGRRNLRCMYVSTGKDHPTGKSRENEQERMTKEGWKEHVQK